MMPDEIDGVKFSEFPSATPDNADEVVGLHSGDNARFSVANFVLAVRQGLANLFVPVTRKVNNKALSADITLDASDVGAVDADDVGVAGGVAELDENGKVPTSQLPTMPSDVEANPAGTATATLTKLKVDDTIYSVSGGGGADEATIAPVEASTTASEAHPLGSIFYLNGVLYRALADIAIGGTINTGSGGNATQTTVAQNFKRTVTLTSAQYAQLSAAEKAADIVYIVTDEPPPEISTATPNMDGTGAAGSTGEVSDAGHVHPSDTSKANQAQLAYVESGTTASRAYAMGEWFCRGGKSLRAKTAIAQGATFTEGTNCVEKTSGSLLKAFISHIFSSGAHTLQLEAGVYLVVVKPFGYTTSYGVYIVTYSVGVGEHSVLTVASAGSLPTLALSSSGALTFTTSAAATEVSLINFINARL